jgi:transposase-like protein
MLTIEVEPAVVNSVDRYLTWQSVMARAQEVVAGALRELVNGSLDDEVTGALGRERRAPRAASGEVELPWGCGRCGTRRARDFERDGHYPRQLQTTGGSLAEVRVPMLECKVCGGGAEMEFAALPKHQQLWLDIDAEVLFAYGTEEGLRHIGDRVGRALGWPVSPASIQRRVHQLQATVEAWHQERIADPPDVLMIDGLWFTAVLPTEARFADRKGRNRPQVVKVKRVALVVLGLWSKTGRREVLDFEIAAGEDEATVVRLLNRLHDRGVTEAHVKLIASDGADGIIAGIGTVYPTVGRQRCIVHKLDNVWEHVRDRTHRAELMRAAAAIYDATDVAEAHSRLQALIAEWLALEAEAVACLVTDFEASIAYLAVPGLREPHRFRTINALEGGVMRPLRRKVDHATAFRSQTGAEVTIFLAIQRLNAHQRGQPWSRDADRLFETYANLNP